jgi:hypothetical protein
MMILVGISGAALVVVVVLYNRKYR